MHSNIFYFALFIVITIAIIATYIITKKANKKFSIVSNPPWTQEQIAHIYNMMNDPNISEFSGCTDFINCYINKLQTISSYEYLMNHMTHSSEDPYDEEVEQFWEKIDNAKDNCLSSFDCDSASRPMLKKRGRTIFSR